MTLIGSCVTLIAAFVLGFALARANSCTVASTRRLVLERRPDWFLGLLIAVSWAGLLLQGLHGWQPDRFALPGDAPLTLRLALGAVLVGVGAVLNRGCFLGSVVQLGRGDVNYVLTLVGVACALWLTSGTREAVPWPQLVRADGGLDGGASLLAVLVLGGVAVLGLLHYRRRRREPILALIVVGISGGLVYGLNPDWSYSAVIERAVRGDISYAAGVAGGAAIALFAGAIVSSMVRHRFRVVGLSAVAGLGCLVGGFLMGFGAKLIPGGNDTLMLWSIPGLTAYGPAAYGVMVLTIALLVAAPGRLRLRFQRTARPRGDGPA